MIQNDGFVTKHLPKVLGTNSKLKKQIAHTCTHVCENVCMCTHMHTHTPCLHID